MKPLFGVCWRSAASSRLTRWRNVGWIEYIQFVNLIVSFHTVTLSDNPKKNKAAGKIIRRLSFLCFM